tara:strand:+ start:483 stop:650 length:168 start_codon:yes stop_codon:yes gene_type:complete
MKAENKISYKMWCYEMFRANTEERIEFKQAPYPRCSDYVNANRDFLRSKYREFEE